MPAAGGPTDLARVSIRALRFERFETRLRDGAPVVVRPVEASDKPLLLAGFRRLSARSRYARFMSPVAELSEEQVRYLTEIDYRDHFAWAAVRGDWPEEGIGVARFVRLVGEPSVAEAAVTVLDEYQGRGLGTLLLGLLAVAARAAGVKAFRAYVREENEPMRELLLSLGASADFDSPGVLRLDVPLDPQLLPDSPAARVLKAVAAQVIHVTGPPPHWIDATGGPSVGRG